MKQFTITANIWLSLGIFALGMVLSTVLNQALSAEAALRVTALALFPTVQQSETAEKSFERTIKAFSDAVLVQDAEKLEAATTEGRRAVTALQTIAGIQNISAQQAADAQKIAVATEQFLADAHATYAEALGNRQMSPELQARVGALASRTEAVKNSLKQMTEQSSVALRDQLSDLPGRSRTQRWRPLPVAAAALAGAGAFSFLMIRSTNRSLWSALQTTAPRRDPDRRRGGRTGEVKGIAA